MFGMFYYVRAWYIGTWLPSPRLNKIRTDVYYLLE